MSDSPTLSEADLRLVDALQLEPRASWSALAETLGTSAMSVARRWRALTDAGLAWSGSTMGPALFRGLFVRIACPPARTGSLAAILAELPEVLTTGLLTGPSNLYAIIVTPTPASMARFVEERLRVIDGAEVQVDPYSRVFGGPTWRLGVLDPDEAADIRRRRPPAAGGPTTDRADRALFLALARDARRTLTELADELDVTTDTVRRHLTRMRAQRRLALRADLARPLSGWPLAAVVRLAVPEASLLSVARDVGRWPETRFCASTTATENLVVVLNLRDLDSLGEQMERLHARHPDAVVVERSLVPRLLKINGHVLDEQGRSERVVPVDPWINERGINERGINERGINERGLDDS